MGVVCCNKKDEDDGCEVKEHKFQMKPLPSGGIKRHIEANHLEYTKKYFTQCPQSEIILYHLEKDQLSNFLELLDIILNHIYKLTSKVMLPVSIQNSPVQPYDYMVVMVRTVEIMRKTACSEPDFTEDFKMIASQFELKEFNFSTIIQDDREFELFQFLTS